MFPLEIVCFLLSYTDQYLKNTKIFKSKKTAVSFAGNSEFSISEW